MSIRKRSAAIGTGWVIGLASLFAIPATFISLSSAENRITVRGETNFVLDVDFEEFRQNLLKANATTSIVENGGMTLVDERVVSLRIDLSKDPRPLRNALAGKSKSEVFATKRLIVALDDPQLSTKQLELEQHVKIQLASIYICTKSTESSGELLSYETTLEAKKSNGQTEVSLSVDMTIDVRVSPVFLSQAESRVQQGANQAVLDQEKAIRQLVSNLDSK